jgi:hypothetical protein
LPLATVPEVTGEPTTLFPASLTVKVTVPAFTVDVLVTVAERDTVCNDVLNVADAGEAVVVVALEGLTRSVPFPAALLLLQPDWACIVAVTVNVYSAAGEGFGVTPVVLIVRTDCGVVPLVDTVAEEKEPTAFAGNPVTESVAAHAAWLLPLKATVIGYVASPP